MKYGILFNFGFTSPSMIALDPPEPDTHYVEVNAGSDKEARRDAIRQARRDGVHFDTSPFAVMAIVRKEEGFFEGPDE